LCPNHKILKGGFFVPKILKEILKGTELEQGTGSEILKGTRNFKRFKKGQAQQFRHNADCVYTVC
jgi:hypothetical protein